MSIFNVGDEVEREELGYTGVVVGYHPVFPWIVRIKRHDGRSGGFGDFWQTNELDLKLISTFSLINE